MNNQNDLRQPSAYKSVPTTVSGSPGEFPIVREQVTDDTVIGKVGEEVICVDFLNEPYRQRLLDYDKLTAERDQLAEKLKEAMELLKQFQMAAFIGKPCDCVWQMGGPGKEPKLHKQCELHQRYEALKKDV